jgi:multiple sugar transport system permease protein
MQEATRGRAAARGRETGRPRLRLGMRRREAIEGYLYCLPWIIGFLVFILGPTLVSLYLSFTRYDILRPPLFVGLDNYRRAATIDPLFWTSLWRTFYFALLTVPASILASLGLAMLLNRQFRGVVLYRTAFFLPHLVPIAAATLIWLWILHPRYGFLNALLGLFGIPGPGWLNSVEWAIPGLALIALWRSAGGNPMIIFLAALQGVPKELQEAATLDGANAWQRFRNVTLPSISPAVFFNLVLGLIAALKVFAIALIATDGGPAYATYFFAVHIYKHAFAFFNMGYAAALAWVFLLIVVALTWVQFHFRKRFVYYEDDRRS